MATQPDIKITSTAWTQISTAKRFIMQLIGGKPIKVAFAKTLPDPQFFGGIELSTSGESVLNYNPSSAIDNCYVRLIDKSNDIDFATISLSFDE